MKRAAFGFSPALSSALSPVLPTMLPTLLSTALLLAACSEPQAGEPVVTVSLDDPAGAQEDAGEIVPAPELANAPDMAAAGPSACSLARFESVEFTHCIADPQSHTINVVYGPGDQSSAYGSLAAFAQSAEVRAEAEAGTIAFAMNGGAFSDDLAPRGYLVSSGERLAELDREAGDGNFYLKPNGVFFGTAGEWRVVTTAQFFASVRDRPQFGTQSGPMLLVDGKLADAISADGSSRAVRNGVGVDTAGKAHFVIANAPVSFGQLARYLRDQAKARNALFLDANSSALWDPASGRLDPGRTGPIVLVSRKEK